MARKTTTTRTTSNRDLVKFCAFWGIVIAAVLFVVTAILNWVGGNLGLVQKIFDVIAKVALLVAIAIPAYGYVRGRRVGWKVTYWVALVVYVLGVVLSVIKI